MAGGECNILCYKVVGSWRELSRIERAPSGDQIVGGDRQQTMEHRPSKTFKSSHHILVSTEFAQRLHIEWDVTRQNTPHAYI
jgi:hypothetical protein